MQTLSQEWFEDVERNLVTDKRHKVRPCLLLITIDVKKRLRFLFWSHFLRFLTFFYFVDVFIFLNKRWQNRRVSKRKNGNYIMQSR